jgi:hypothetical protein
MKYIRKKIIAIFWLRCYVLKYLKSRGNLIKGKKMKKNEKKSKKMKKNPAKKIGQFSESSSGQFTNITNTYDVFAVYVGGSRGIIRLGIYWGRKLNFKKNYTQKKKRYILQS